MQTKIPLLRQQPKHIHYWDDIEQGTEEWLAFRENKFTGSNAGRLLTYGATTQAMAHNSNFKGNFYTRRGHLLEPEAVALYEQIKGVEVGHTGFVTNDRYPNCLYSPDGFTNDRVIEVKCFNPKRHLACAKNPDVGILAQCHWGQMIMELPRTDLVFYCPDSSLKPEDMLIIVPVEYSQAVQDNFRKKLEVYYAR